MSRKKGRLPPGSPKEKKANTLSSYFKYLREQEEESLKNAGKAFHVGSMSDDDVGVLFRKLEDWQRKVSLEYTIATQKDGGAVLKRSINLKSMLDSLPKGNREALLQEYMNITQISQRLHKASIGGTSSAGIDSVLNWVKSGRGRYAGIAVPASDLAENFNPLSMIFSRTNIRFTPWRRKLGGSMVDELSIGSNILNIDYLRDMYDSLKAGNIIGSLENNEVKPIIVFDVETAGLSDSSGIRQISAHKMEVLSDDVGGVTFSKPEQLFDEHFKTERMKLGSLFEGKSSKRMDKALKDMGAIPKGVDAIPGDGDEFVRAIKPFLEDIVETVSAGGKIAGHNIQFDIDKVFVNLRKTTAYHKNIDGFADLLDKATESVTGRGVMIDTLELARQKLPGLHVDDDLVRLGRGGSHSMTNLMLQTNLGDLLVEDLGADEVKNMLGVGSKKFMHMGDIDTRIEAYLMQYLAEGRIKPKQLTGSSIGGAGDKVRKAVLKAYAPTPTSIITDVSHIDPTVFGQMWSEAIDEFGEKALAPEDVARLNTMFPDSRPARGRKGKGVRIRSRKASSFNAEEVRKLLADETYSATTQLKITPLEQDIVLSRNLSSLPTADIAGIADDEILDVIGSSRTLFSSGVVPDASELAVLQQRLARAGMPFSGLSLPERWLTEGMVAASALSESVSMGPLEKKAAKYASDIGITRFSLLTDARVTKGGAIQLPLQALRQATLEGAISTNLLGDQAEMLSMSYGTAGQGEKNVFFRMELEDDQAKKMATWLEGLHAGSDEQKAMLTKFGVDDTTLPKLLKALRHGTEDTHASVSMSGGRRVVGINIGRLKGAAGAAAYDVMSSLMGVDGDIRDDTLLKFRAGLIGGEEGDRVGRVGGFVLDRFMKEEERVAYGADLGRAQRMQDRVMEMLSDKSTARRIETGGAARKIVDTIGGSDSAVNRIIESSAKESIERGYGWAKSIEKKGAPILIGAAALGMFYGMYKKKKKQDKYDETFEPQEIEERSKSANNYYSELNLTPQRYGTIDPLSTAGLVDSLHNNSIKHTIMSTQKYQNLFNGAI